MRVLFCLISESLKTDTALAEAKVAVLNSTAVIVPLNETETMEKDPRLKKIGEINCTNFVPFLQKEIGSFLLQTE